MRRLSVTLETVTPMFLAGIHQDKPELRPPSVLGQMRYWLRAALGAVVGNDLKALKKAEAEVFGDTGGTGAVEVRMPQPKTALTVEDFNPLPHKQKRFNFKGFQANQQFEIWLTQRGGSEATWLAAISALLLMVSIGGLGRRCRRGWGTVRIVEVDVASSGLDKTWQNVLNQSANTPNSAQKWFDYLNFSIGVAEHCARGLCKNLEPNPGKIKAPTPYPIASSKAVTSTVTQSIYPSEIKAIEVFHREEHKFGVSKAFGSADPRQGSPLWVRVLPITTPQRGYVLAITFFNTRLANDNQDAEYITKFLGIWDSVKEEKKKK